MRRERVEPFWDVLEEHLEEAAFAWGQLAKAFDSPLHRLAEVESGGEERLLAHLDGLVLGGMPVAERLLLPALEHGEEPHVFSAASALLRLDPARFWQTPISALQGAPEAKRAALSRALELAPLEIDSERLRPLLESQEEALLLTGLELAIGRRLPVPPAAWKFALGASTPLRIRAVFAAAQVGGVGARDLERSVRREDLPVQTALAIALLPLEPARGVQHCRALLSSNEPETWSAAALGMALCSERPEDLEVLLRATADPRRARDALWALGFRGDAATADRCLEVASQSKGLNPIACEAFAAITGADAQVPELFATPTSGEVEEEQNPLDVQLAEGDAERLCLWWRDQPRKTPGRLLRGAPLSASVLRKALLNEPMRRRPALALQAQVRLARRNPARTRALTQVQYADVNELPG